MEPRTAAEWVSKRACSPCRKNDSYEHKACIEAKEIYDMLSSAVKVDAKVANGDRIEGWLIPE